MFDETIKEIRSAINVYWKQRAKNSDRVAAELSRTISKLNDINDFGNYISGVQSMIQKEFRIIEKRSEELALTNKANQGFYDFIIRMNHTGVLPTNALISAGFPYPHKLKPQSIDDLRDR